MTVLLSDNVAVAVAEAQAQRRMLIKKSSRRLVVTDQSPGVPNGVTLTPNWVECW